jgi:hypothetical protein
MEAIGQENKGEGGCRGKFSDWSDGKKGGEETTAIAQR